MRLLQYLFPARVGRSLLLAAPLCLIGCSGGILPLSNASTSAISGNWQISSTAPAASRLPILSGSLTGSSTNVTGIFHAGSSSACISPAAPITLAGHTDVENTVTLTGPVAGGTLTIAGTLSADGKSLSSAFYNITGGSCAFTGPADATAQSYSSVTGTYLGSFSDSEGPVLTVTANLMQSPDSNTSGNFQLSGTGTFPNNSCFSSPISISNSQVTGGSFTISYTDPTRLNTVTATGVFSPDANTLTITTWTLSGGNCLTDSGTGSFTRQ